VVQLSDFTLVELSRIFAFLHRHTAVSPPDPNFLRSLSDVLEAKAFFLFSGLDREAVSMLAGLCLAGAQQLPGSGLPKPQVQPVFPVSLTADPELPALLAARLRGDGMNETGGAGRAREHAYELIALLVHLRIKGYTLDAAGNKWLDEQLKLELQVMDDVHILHMYVLQGMINIPSGNCPCLVVHGHTSAYCTRVMY
jgi:hypothetical protein